MVQKLKLKYLKINMWMATIFVKYVQTCVLAKQA
jgi:hypothetical protein